MFINIILLFNIFSCVNTLRILFAPGSLIKRSFYNKFIDKLESKIKKPIEYYNFTDGFLRKNNDTNEEEIIIGHSFGGTLALCNHLYNNSNIIGVVLLQSHFNQRNTKPYFGINQSNIDIPVLTVLNSHDDKLPIHCSIDDFLVSYQENISNKYYLINNGTHLSSFENRIEVDKLSSQVGSFIYSIVKNTFYRMNYINNYITSKHFWFFEERNLTNTTVQPDILHFVLSKPYTNNSIYLNHKYVLYKTNNINITEELNVYYNLNLNYNITRVELNKTIDIMNTKDTMQKIIKHFMTGFNIWNFYLFLEFIIKEITNDFFISVQKPGLLFTWFTYEPQIYIKNKRIECEVLAIPIKDNIVYYKFPSKHKMMEFLVQHDLL